MAKKAWAERDCWGAIARARDELYKANLPLKQFSKVKLPKQVEKFWMTKEYVVNLENLIWKTRMYIGGPCSAGMRM